MRSAVRGHIWITSVILWLIHVRKGGDFGRRFTLSNANQRLVYCVSARKRVDRCNHLLVERGSDLSTS